MSRRLPPVADLLADRADDQSTIARLTAERDRMRPVVEAAVEWALADYVDTLPGGKADQRLRGAVGAWERQG